MIKNQDWKDAGTGDTENSVDVSGGGASNDRYHTVLLPAGDFLYLPNGRFLDYFSQTSAANEQSLTNLAPDSNEYTDSTADVDDGSGLDIIGSASETKVFLEPYTSAANCTANLFRVGDLIRVNNEIMEVTAIGDKSDLANNYLTVIRGTHGSTAASDHADDAAIRLPFFNAYNNYDRYSVAQTNKNGKFKCNNFFGYGRTLTNIADGIVPGSVAIKFYSQGYQEVGLSGITASTNTGLSASTVYYFKIAVDGGSAYEVAFTTDATNTNFGGKNGILSKIQSILDVQYYTEGNLFEKKATVGLVNGDIRFTSGSKLSTSAIALTAGTSGTPNTDELFDGTNQIARFPAKVETAVAARLPEDTLFSRVSNISKPNISAFMFDDGNGNLLGAGTGTINYSSGALDFTSAENAEFVVSANYLSAHSGGANHTSAGVNQFENIYARSVNQKLNTSLQVIAYGE